MSTHLAAPKVLVARLTTMTMAACATESPVAPETSPAASGSLSARPEVPPGVYDLAFHASGDWTYEDITTLPVLSRELILKAYVADSAGRPAGKGTVTFEYCSYKGGPPNDITRPDEAPKEACEQGSASWARLTSMSVSEGRCPTLGTGYACMNFGIVRIPRTVGFRFRYASQGSGIASGISAARNFTWVEGP
jgi:hypothetical protein